MPGVAWKVEFIVPWDSFVAHSDDPASITTQISEEALHAPPASIEVKRPSGQLFVVARVGHSQVKLQATSEHALTLVRVEVSACNSTTAVEGPGGVYRRISSLSRALGAESMKWSTQVLNLHSVLEEDLATLSEIDESQGNLLALAEYYGMMGDISEDKSLVASEMTAFTRASVWQFGSGTRLVLGGIVMSDTRDEHIYHEMLVQPALLATDSPAKVLIIGGGEGAALREVLKDPRVQHVTMVEIDQGLVDLCKVHLSTMHHGSFNSPKATITFEDGAVFLQRAAPETFDVVVIDGIDFQDDQSYGNVLFSEPFYQDVFNVLRPGGVLTQYMSHVERSDEMAAAGFNDTVSFTVDVPSFFGAGARFTVAGKGVPEPLPARVVQRVQHRADAGALHDWAYLRPNTLVAGLNHGGRRLKGLFGGGGGPGYGSWGRARYVGYTSFHNDHMAYATFVVLHTRRRRGVWLDSRTDGCSYAPNMMAADGGSGGGGVTELCQRHFSTYYVTQYMSYCHNCDECSNEACVRAILGCSNFLSELYGTCQQETNLVGDIVDFIFNLLFWGCFCLCACGSCANEIKSGILRRFGQHAAPGGGERGAAQHHLFEERFGMRSRNGVGLGSLELEGTYTELSQTQSTRYTLFVAADGEFSGSCTDADGVQQIQGLIVWNGGEDSGRIAWQETRPSVITDALGTIRRFSGPSGDPRVSVNAEYISTYDYETRGSVALCSTGAVAFNTHQDMPWSGHPETAPLTANAL